MRFLSYKTNKGVIRMKKKTVVILISCLVLLAVAVFLASGLFHMGKFRLSALSNRQCAKFLVAQGVTIPEEFADLDFRKFFSFIEDNPHRNDFSTSWRVLDKLSKDIYDIVIAYYEIEP